MSADGGEATPTRRGGHAHQASWTHLWTWKTMRTLEEGRQGSEVEGSGQCKDWGASAPVWWDRWLDSPWVLEVRVVPGVPEVH